METIRVLQVITELGTGGIQSFIMNVYRNIDRHRIQFDFLLNTPQKGDLEDEIEELGGRVYRVTPRSSSFFKNKKDLEAFFAQHKEYRCVHCHFSSLSYLMPLKMAAKAGVPTRIIHSHNTHLSGNPIHKALHLYNKHRLDRIATDFYACSDLAGNWLFGGTAGAKKQIIVNNGIQANKYLYNAKIRDEYRKQLGSGEKKVIGNIGRLSEAKNLTFLVDTFAHLLKLDPHVFLVLVGDGPEKEKLCDQIHRLGIASSVKMLGMRQDVPALLQAFDCFLMPSRWEGLPVALLEAEAAGLPAYVSDTVTTQARINDNVSYLSLAQGPKKWAEIIHEASTTWQRIETVDKIIDAGFDIQDTVNMLQDKYIRSYLS